MESLRSCLRYCLLCGGDKDDKGEASKLGGIVGGVNCVSLERQLEKMFVLLRVLEVPSEWCEATLNRGGDDGGESCDNNPDKWFTLCDKCVEGNVTRAWEAYQNILKWQTRMLTVKVQILEGMKRSILKTNQSQSVPISSQVDCEIKRYLFPELFAIKVEQLEEVLEESLAEDSMDLEYDAADEDNDSSFISYQNILSAEPFKNKQYSGRRGDPESVKTESLSAPVHQNDPFNLAEVNFNQDEEGQVFNDIPADEYYIQDNQPELKMDVDPEVTPIKPVGPSGRGRGRPRIHPPRTTPSQGRRGRPRIHPPKTTPSQGRRGRPRIHPPRTTPSQGRRGRPRIHPLGTTPSQVNRGRPRIHPPRTTPSQGRRGRPRIHPPKPPPRHGQPGRPRLHAPGTYYSQRHLKAKRFHWSTCSICTSRYSSTEEYTSHMALHSQRDPTSKGPLDCTQCPFPARDPQELDYHIRRRHFRKPQSLKQGGYSCPKCPFTTILWKSLRAHVDIDHSTVPLHEFGPDISLKCPECDQQYVNCAKYQTHRRMDHPPDKLKGPVQCPQCEMKFLSQSLLTYHVNSMHKRLLRHICDECGKGFEFINLLDKHKEGHLKKKEGPLRKREHICEECGLDFWEERTFKKHYKTQHGGGGVGGTRAPAVVVGEGLLRAPEDDKMFQCKYCDVRSSLASFIKRHVQEEHKGEMAYQCDKCERRYTNAQGLKRHVRLNHGTEEWPCPHCGKRFKAEDYMKDHVKRFCKLKDLTVVVEGVDGERVEISGVGGGDRGHHQERLELWGQGSS